MSFSKEISFCDLKKQYLSVEKEVNKAIKKVLTSGWYILGKEVKSFEQEFANYCSSSFGIGVASGTEALYLALLACGSQPGDEVITVANAGVPGVSAIAMAGAIPVFVDTDPGNYNMNVSKIEEKITDKQKRFCPYTYTDSALI